VILSNLRLRCVSLLCGHAAPFAPVFAPGFSVLPLPIYLNLLLFGLIIGLGAPSAHAKDRHADLPKSFARLSWDARFERYVGRALYQVPQVSQDSRVSGDKQASPSAAVRSIDLALYLNRSLLLNNENRADKEFNAVGYPGEDVWTMDRRGSLVVENVYWASGTSGASPCSNDPNDLMERLLDSSKADEVALVRAEYALNEFDTILSVRQQPQPHGCEILVVDFLATPPRTKGNFGANGPDQHIFSGPLIPLARGRFYDTQVLYTDSYVTCYECQTTADKYTLQFFDGFPSPLHITFQRPLAIQEIEIRGLKIGIVGSLPESVKKEVTLSLDEILARETWTQNLPVGPSGYHLLVAGDILVERLALTQTGEVQLGGGLFKISPLFEKYHRAAFERELLYTLGGIFLAANSPPKSWQDYRFNTAVNRYFAMGAVKRRHQDLDGIKRVSSKFDFVPLFDDILRGKALQNNEVFLGDREPPSRIDVQAAELFVPSLGGKDLDERLNYCGGVELQRQFASSVERIFLGIDRAERLRKRLGNFPWSLQKCPLGLSALLEFRPVAESFSVARLQVGEEDNVIRFFRSRDISSDSHLFEVKSFGGAKDAEYHDSPRIFIHDPSDDRNLLNQVWQAGEKQSYIVDVKVPSTQTVTAAVEGPTLGSSQDRQQYPRKYKFTISGFKFRYGSKDIGARIETGVQFRLLGDEFMRSVSMSAAVDNKQSELNAGFGLNFAELFGIPVYSVESLDEPALDSSVSLPFYAGVAGVFPQSGASSGALVTEFGIADSVGNPLVPRGYSLSTKIRWQVLERAKPVSIFSQDFRLVYDQPMGRLTTLSLQPLIGYSTGAVKLSDYVPGSSEVFLDSRASDEFFALTSEVKSVVGSGYNLDILGTLLFQDLVAYGAHHVASGVSVLSSQGKVADLVQSAEIGLQLFGSVFGAKNQSLALSVTRTLSNEPRNSFAVTIGK
jgi:hypothetical protein